MTCLRSWCWCGCGALITHQRPEVRCVALAPVHYAVILGPFSCEAEGKEETGRMNEGQETIQTNARFVKCKITNLFWCRANEAR